MKEKGEHRCRRTPYFPPVNEEEEDGRITTTWHWLMWNSSLLFSYCFLINLSTLHLQIWEAGKQEHRGCRFFEKKKLLLSRTVKDAVMRRWRHVIMSCNLLFIRHIIDKRVLTWRPPSAIRKRETYRNTQDWVFTFIHLPCTDILYIVRVLIWVFIFVCVMYC